MLNVKPLMKNMRRTNVFLIALLFVPAALAKPSGASRPPEICTVTLAGYRIVGDDDRLAGMHAEARWSSSDEFRNAYPSVPASESFVLNHKEIKVMLKPENNSLSSLILVDTRGRGRYFEVTEQPMDIAGVEARFDQRNNRLVIEIHKRQASSRSFVDVYYAVDFSYPDPISD